MNVEIQGLSKSFGSQIAVNNISFIAKKGEILGFLGPNGAGKTTTMKMTTGYIGIQQGDILIGGKSIKQEDFNSGCIGYLPESNPLYADMTVVEHLRFCARIQKIPKSSISQRIKEMIVVCGLDKEKHKKIQELSKGYRQRVGLAQAMIHDPEVLILDEPTSGLDPNQIVQIRELIKTLGKEKTVIFSTHILSEVEAICDKIIIINNGLIVANGTMQSLTNSLGNSFCIELSIENVPTDIVVKNLKNLPGVDSVELNDNIYTISTTTKELSKTIFELCIEKKWVLTKLTTIETKLEEIFKNLTS